MFAQGSLLSAPGWFLLHSRDGSTHYYVFVPNGLPEPDEHLPYFFDAEVVRITGEADNARFYGRLTASAQAPPRGQQVGRHLVLMMLGRVQYQFALPQSTTPPVERFTMEVSRILVTPPEPPQEPLEDALSTLEIARFGHPLPSLGPSHPPQQVNNQIEIGYRLRETSRQGASATSSSSQAPEARGESSSATASRQPSGPRPPPPSFIEDTSNVAAAAAPPGGMAGQTALSPSNNSGSRSPPLRGGSVTSDSDDESGREEGDREEGGREEGQRQ